MPKAYMILTEVIRDPDGMKAYGKAAASSLAEHGVKVLAADAQVEVLEGDWHGDQTVVLEFESVEAAREWYDSDAYGPAKALRHAAAESNAVLITAFEPRER
jgi:uncharacterized protein (DUF1330 family)